MAPRLGEAAKLTDNDPTRPAARAVTTVPSRCKA
jgi:hypothetical protein